MLGPQMQDQNPGWWVFTWEKSSREPPLCRTTGPGAVHGLRGASKVTTPYATGGSSTVIPSKQGPPAAKSPVVPPC